MENLFYLIPIALIFYFGLFVVNQQTTAIVERFGKFTSIRQ
jgi:regulator of protease activity HflC (stomatin/prohibitin superfamily)